MRLWYCSNRFTNTSSLSSFRLKSMFSPKKRRNAGLQGHLTRGSPVISSTPGTLGGWNSSWYDRPLKEISIFRMSTKNLSLKRPGQVEPSSANPPDQKTVVNSKLDNRVQGFPPLFQHYIQLLCLAYCPAKAMLSYFHGELFLCPPRKAIQKESIFAFRFVQIIRDHP